MKKRLSIFLLMVALLVPLTSITGSASGHHRGGRYRSNASYAVCNVDSCNIGGNHRHNGTYYRGHTLGDGHDYHELCGVENCTYSGVHSHDGNYYFAHHTGDGHNYHQGRTHSGRGYCR